MKKGVKRTHTESSSKRARTKPKAKRTACATSADATGKPLLPEVKSVAKKVALAAGVAAVGTAAALSALKSDQNTADEGGSDQDEFKRRITSDQQEP